MCVMLSRLRGILQVVVSLPHVYCRLLLLLVKVHGLFGPLGVRFINDFFYVQRLLQNQVFQGRGSQGVVGEVYRDQDQANGCS